MSQAKNRLSGALISVSFLGDVEYSISYKHFKKKSKGLVMLDAAQIRLQHIMSSVLLDLVGSRVIISV